MKKAEILSVGTELMMGEIVDTHAATAARLLAQCGIACQRRATVGDTLADISDAIKDALTRADIVITIGGLGPTTDDLTRDGIAAALGDTLVEVPEIADKLKRIFTQRGIPWVESNARQAFRPESGKLIDNPNGTAPGLHCQKDGKHVFALPGPKGEFEPMLQNSIRPILEELGGGSTIFTRTLRVTGMGESYIEQLLGDLMESKQPTVAPYAKTGEVHLRLAANAPTKEGATALLDPVEAEIRQHLGHAIYGLDGTTLESALIDLLKARGESVSVAESLTGGTLGARWTSVPGASAVFHGGIVAYANESKEELLDVSRDLLNAEGAISDAVAQAMAKGVRHRFETTWGMSTTGNAGPDAQEGKPVGLVYVSVSNGVETRSRRVQFRGLREDVRTRASQAALTILWDWLSELV